MITEKFQYIALTRNSGPNGRTYNTPNNERLVSVTTILDATKPDEKRKSLMEWKKRMGDKKAQEITTEASSRGTRMHKFLEDYVKNGQLSDSGSNPYSKQSHGMAQIIIEQGLKNCDEFWGVEIGLHYPSIYAGTTDLIGIHGGSEAIMDFKQTNKPKKAEWIEDYFFQLCAYANAHNELYGTNIRKGVIFMCSKDNEYQEFVIEGQEFDRWNDGWWKRVEEYYLKHA